MQSRIRKHAQFNSIFSTLKRALGDRQHLTIAQLARHICAEQTNQSLEETVESLLQGGYSVAQLIAALLQCESVRMKGLFPAHSTLPLNVQFNELRRAIHEFNHFQDVIMSVGEAYLTDLQARNIRGAISVPGHQEDRFDEYAGRPVDEISSMRESAIEQAIAAWTENRKVYLFNPFRGLYVTATATLRAKGKQKISISFDQDVARVFASHSNGNQAFLLCPGGDIQVAASILKLEPSKLTLALEDIFPAYIDKRRDVGVQVADKIIVKLSARGMIPCKAQLFDLSISGMGVVLSQGSELPFEQGDEIQCEFTLNEKAVRCTGWVRWLQTVEGIPRIGLELKPDRSQQYILQQEIFRLQRLIIAAMQEIELPENMLTALAG